MAISVQVRGAEGVISMSGRFDFRVHHEFKDAYTELLNNHSVREIEIEMSQLEYIDSSALGMLLLLNERAKAENKSISKIIAAGTVAQVLEVANFGKIFNITHAHVQARAEEM